MSAERQRRYKQRNAEGGLASVAVLVPLDRVAELRAFAAELRGGVAPRAARRTRTPDPAQMGLPLPPAEADQPTG